MVSIVWGCLWLSYVAFTSRKVFLLLPTVVSSTVLVGVTRGAFSFPPLLLKHVFVDLPLAWWVFPICKKKLFY